MPQVYIEVSENIFIRSLPSVVSVIDAKRLDGKDVTLYGAADIVLAKRVVDGNQTKFYVKR